jgi:hypothetical protein
MVLPLRLAFLRLWWLSQFPDQRDQNLSTKICHLRRLRLAYLFSLKALVALTFINY